MSKKNQFKTEWRSNITAIKEEEYDKYHISKASMLKEAQASSLIPENFAPWDNIDIMPILMSIAIVNKFNDNDDAVPSMGAAKMLPKFPHKPINIEHQKNIIVGHLVRAGFAEYEPAFAVGDPLDYINRSDSFYISGLGFIYRSVFPELAEAIARASDPYDDTYNAYAASWEVAFSSYDVAVGDGELIQDTRIVTADDPQFQSLSAMLKFNGGSGKTHKGEKVRRVLRGEKIPVGLGLTENPAAAVEGIYALASISDEKISENKETDVTDNETNIAMDKEEFDKFKKEVSDMISSIASKDGSSDSPAQEVFEKLNTLFEEKGKDWKSQSDQHSEDMKNTQAALKQLEDQLKDAKDTINKFQDDISVRDAADKLNTRMATIASQFALEEAEEAIVAKEVQGLPADDEAFASYLEKVKVVFAHRNKEAIAAAKAEAEANKGEGEENKDDKSKEGETKTATKASKNDEGKEDKEDSPDMAKQLATLDAQASPLLNNIGEDAEGLTLFQRFQQNGLALEDNK